MSTLSVETFLVKRLTLPMKRFVKKNVSATATFCNDTFYVNASQIPYPNFRDAPVVDISTIAINWN